MKEQYSWDKLLSGAAWHATYSEYVIVEIITIINCDKNHNALCEAA